MCMSKEIDYEFFWRLSSLYEALTMSAVDSVVVPSSYFDKDNKRKGIFSYVYYDAADDEDVALRIMEKRKFTAFNVVRENALFHVHALKYFYDIEERANVHNRRSVANVTQNLCVGFGRYINFVKEHRSVMGNKAFLNYPTCISGHYFQVAWHDGIREKEFNAEQSWRMGLSDCIRIRETADYFARQNGKIPPVQISERRDEGEGITDNSLRARVELNKQLVKRAGIDLE